MHSTDPIRFREVQFAEIANSETERTALEAHVREIVEGKAFKGSARSVKFLEYIVKQAIAGHFEALKERVIGVELFGRSPSYETGEDSIVRVAAGDVRKRLVQHYSIYGVTSDFQLSLPPGSYILEITRRPRGVQAGPPSASRGEGVRPAGADAAAEPDHALNGKEQAASAALLVATQSANQGGLKWHHWLYFGLMLMALSAAEWGFWSNHYAHESVGKISVLPWPALFSSTHATVLVTSDPNIAEIQVLAGRTISTSDYANHQYIPEPNSLTPEELEFCKRFLIGDKAASVDAPIVANIAQLAQADSKKIELRAARQLELSDLHTDDNFIFLGSPGSNPWVSLFSKQLDFRFDPSPKPGLDTIVNIHPLAHELPAYVPTAPGYATGQSFAIVAFVQNPDQNGQVMILAGASREGTEAAGKFVVDLPRLSKALQKCGIEPSGPVRHFEMLLQVNMMAGLPNNSDMVACHILQGGQS